MFSFPAPTGRFVRPFPVTLRLLPSEGRSQERTVVVKMCLLPPLGGTVILYNTCYVVEEVRFNAGTRKGIVVLSPEGPADGVAYGNTETRAWAESISYAENAFRLCLTDLWEAEEGWQPADWHHNGRGIMQWFDYEELPAASVHWQIEEGYMFLSYQLGGEHIQERITIGQHLRHDKQYHFRCPCCNHFRKVLYGLERFLCVSCHGLRYGESIQYLEEQPATRRRRHPSKAAIAARRNQYTAEHRPLISLSDLRRYTREDPASVVIYSR